jgi:hypothetical protein
MDLALTREVHLWAQKNKYDKIAARCVQMIKEISERLAELESGE